MHSDFSPARANSDINLASVDFGIFMDVLGSYRAGERARLEGKLTGREPGQRSKLPVREAHRIS